MSDSVTSVEPNGSRKLRFDSTDSCLIVFLLLSQTVRQHFYDLTRLAVCDSVSVVGARVLLIVSELLLTY